MPHVGMWIETSAIMRASFRVMGVMPHVGMWIETCGPDSQDNRHGSCLM